MTSPRDNLAAILGLAILHADRYGPAAKALLAEIADEARKGIGAAEATCVDCDDTGIYTTTGGRGWPCNECNPFALEWEVERKHEGQGDEAPVAEVRAWLDARKAPRLGEVRDDAPTREKGTA